MAWPIFEPWTFRIRTLITARRCVLYMMTLRAAAGLIEWAIVIHFTPCQLVSILILSSILTIDENHIASCFLAACLDVRAVTRESRSVVRHLCLSCTNSCKRGHSETPVRRFNQCSTGGWEGSGGWS